MNIIQAKQEHRPSIISLLQESKLPVEDLPELLSHFFVAVADKQVIAVIGLEVYENCGLLRSMVVDPEYRGQNIASELVKRLEEHAAALHLTDIYLLTETAHKYFLRKGYEDLKREQVPASIKASSEFSSVCPVSAIVMKKQVYQ